MSCDVEYSTYSDESGEGCGRPGVAECYECGWELCSHHTCNCDLCGKIYCPSCISEHSCVDDKAA